MPEFLYRVLPARPAMVTEGPTEAEGAAVQDHFAYLQRLTAEGVVVLAGRTLTDDSFGLVVFRAEDEPSARSIMEGDPAVARGVMSAELFPFHVVLSSG